jgi:hybrid cluster-associated redox disulfide protein
MSDAPRCITKEMNIGEIMDAYPETQPVFKKHFGDGCFTCPGARMESVEFGATMHSLDVEGIVADLNRAAGFLPAEEPVA